MLVNLILICSVRKYVYLMSITNAAAVNVEKVVQEMDIQALQDNIVNIAFCDIKLEVC